MLNLTNPKTIEDFAVSTIVDKAKLHDNYLLFWADLMEYCSGNVDAIYIIISLADIDAECPTNEYVAENDIEAVYNQLRKL